MIVHSGLGHTLQLECHVSAMPVAQVIWLRHNRPLGRKTAFTSDGSPPDVKHGLKLDNLTKRDFGEYTCEATNALGTDTAHIMVVGK